MKAISVLLCAASALLTAGCVTTLNQGLQTEEALAVRQVISENCVVGRYTAGKPKNVIYAREGVNGRRMDLPPLQFRHGPAVETIVIYGVRDVSGGWNIYDATTGKVRDNFYYHPQSGAFACSEREWLAGGGAQRQHAPFQRAASPGFAIGQ